MKLIDPEYPFVDVLVVASCLYAAEHEDEVARAVLSSIIVRWYSFHIRDKQSIIEIAQSVKGGVNRLEWKEICNLALTDNKTDNPLLSTYRSTYRDAKHLLDTMKDITLPPIQAFNLWKFSAELEKEIDEAESQFEPFREELTSIRSPYPPEIPF